MVCIVCIATRPIEKQAVFTLCYVVIHVTERLWQREKSLAARVFHWSEEKFWQEGDSGQILYFISN